MSRLYPGRITEEKRNVLKKKVIAGTTVVVVAGAYVLHRRKMDSVITAMREIADESMWSTFDEGVKYGLQLAKEAISSDVGEYAFAAFDKTS